MSNKPVLRTPGVKGRQALLNTFKIEHTDHDGTRLRGTFVSKKLSIRDIAALGVRKAQLNGGMHYDQNKPGQGVDGDTDQFNNMVAHLELGIVEAPEWWNLDQIVDPELIGKVYKEVFTFENTFLRRIWEKNGGELARRSRESDGEDDQAESNSGREPGDVVDEEVSAALEP